MKEKGNMARQESRVIVSSIKTMIRDEGLVAVSIVEENWMEMNEVRGDDDCERPIRLLIDGSVVRYRRP